MPRNKDNSRLRDVTPDELRHMAARCKRAGAVLTALAATMEDAKVKTVNVDGRKMVDYAFEYISAFAGNVQKKIGGF